MREPISAHGDLPPSELAVHLAEGFARPTDASEISPGTEVRALRRGTICHAGEVTDVLDETGIFWILDERSFCRKLIEPYEFTIVVRAKPEGSTPDTKEQE